MVGTCAAVGFPMGAARQSFQLGPVVSSAQCPAPAALPGSWVRCMFRGSGTNPIPLSPQRDMLMSVARVTEITASSPRSFKDALQDGVKRATKTLENVTGAWVQDQEVVIKKGEITEYRVKMRVTFILKD